MTAIIDKNSTKNKATLRNKVYFILEDSNNKSRLAKLINYALILLIFVNVSAAILEAESHLHETYFTQFLIFEIASLVLFIIEYLLRLWCCVETKNPKKLTNHRLRVNYFFTPIALIDLFAILPFIIALFFSIDLRVLRLFRVMRLLKLTHYFKGFNIFISVIGKELKSLFAALMLMLFIIIIAASLMHTVEGVAQPEAFGSILKSFWWAVVTMTTVGYGDVVPLTVGGKIIATFIMLSGVALVALPAGMLAARFTEELRERKKDLNGQIKEMLHNGKIKEDQYHNLEKLADKLDIETDELIRSIALIKQGQHTLKCPHCGN